MPRTRNGDILVVHGDPIEVLTAWRTTPMFWRCTPMKTTNLTPSERDNKVRETFEGLGKPFHTFTDHVIQAPGEVMKPDGSPYTVFTPFSKRWHANLTEDNMAQAPSESHLDALHQWTAPEMPSLEDMGLYEAAFPHPKHTLHRPRLKAYADMRDVPSKPGTAHQCAPEVWHHQHSRGRQNGVQAQRQMVDRIDLARFLPSHHARLSAQHDRCLSTAIRQGAVETR